MKICTFKSARESSRVLAIRLKHALSCFEEKQTQHLDEMDAGVGSHLEYIPSQRGADRRQVLEFSTESLDSEWFVHFIITF